jgi:hypothetical protein
MDTKPKSLADFGGPTRTSGEQIVFQICPVCGSQKWKTYVNPRTGLWWCHAPEHSGGGVVDVGAPLSGAGENILHLLQGQPERVDWPEINLPRLTPLSWRARRYLRRRGIDEQLAARLGIREMEDRMRVVVPYFGPSGGIIYWTARSYSDLEEGPKYLAASGKHPLYVLPSWHPAEDVLVVEGVFDAIAAHQATGRTVVALGGKALPRYLTQDLLEVAAQRLTVALDSDALADALKLRNRLATKRQVTVVPLPLGEDPASMGDSLKDLL